MPQKKKRKTNKNRKKITKKKSNSASNTLSDKKVKKIVNETLNKRKKTAREKKSSKKNESAKIKKQKTIERVLQNLFFGKKIPKTESKPAKEEKREEENFKIERNLNIRKNRVYSPHLIDLKTAQPRQKLESKIEKNNGEIWQFDKIEKPAEKKYLIEKNYKELKDFINQKSKALANILTNKKSDSVDFVFAHKQKLLHHKFLNKIKDALCQLYIVNLFQLTVLLFWEIIKHLIILPLFWFKDLASNLGGQIYQLVPIKVAKSNSEYLPAYKPAKVAPDVSPNLLKSKNKIKGGKLPKAFRPKPPLGWKKSLVGFTLASLVFVTPFQAISYYEKLQDTREEVINLSLQAFDHIKMGSLAINDAQLKRASQEFGQANKNFGQAQYELNKINLLVSNLIKIVPKTGKTFSTGQTLIDSGKNLSLTAQYLTEAAEPFNEKNELKLTKKLALLKEKLLLASPEIAEAKENLSKANLEMIPDEQRYLFKKVKRGVSILEKNTNNLIEISDSLLKILGQEEKKRYLVLFQNDAEIRATGGFIGSYAIMDVDRGKIENIEIPGGGSYDLKGGFLEKIISPQPLRLINAHWQFQDSNWFPDFPASAQKIMWFYERGGGSTVDGVIAITSSLMEELLSVIGPIEMSKYGKNINSENFFFETQSAVELEYDKEENKPKKFITDMAPKVLEKIFKSDKDQLLKFISIFSRALEEKHVLFYFTDEELQKTIKDFNWTGQIKETQKDYLAVINSNIAGQKTDRVIKEKIEHSAEIKEDGSIIDTVTITKTHQGSKGDLFTGVRNVGYIRVYVPEGSILLEAKGFDPPDKNLFEAPEPGYKPDIDLQIIQGQVIKGKNNTYINNEFGKTVFGNWIQVDPGRTEVSSFKYQLPFKLDLEKFKEKNWLEELENKLGLSRESVFYSLLIQKQAGAKNHNFISTVKLPENLRAFWKYPLEISLNRNGVLTYEDKLNKDKFYGLILKGK